MNEPQEGIIFEESSAESWIDPNANRDLSDSISAKSPTKTNAPTPAVSHLRTHSDLVQYTQLDMMTTPPLSSSTASPPIFPSSPMPSSSLVSSTPPGMTAASGTQYASIINPASNTSDYIVMTPTSGNTSSTSSLKRSGLIDHPSKVEDFIPTGVTSPSSQSSYTPQDDEAYQVMSPIESSSMSKAIPVKKTNGKPTNGTEDEAYIVMSPLSSAKSELKNSVDKKKTESPLTRRSKLDIALEQKTSDTRVDSSQEYEVMSPVNVDPERLKRISEEDGGNDPTPLSAIEERLSGVTTLGHTPGTPIHLRGDHGTTGGARPKQYARSTGSKRSSFCSDADGRWSPTSEMWAEHAVKAEEIDNQDYYPIDYSSSSRPGLGKSTASAIPIPSSAAVNCQRMSPASSGSLISGSTPNSVTESRLPHEFHFETKAKSYLRDDDETPDPPSHPLHQPRAHSISVSSSGSGTIKTGSQTGVANSGYRSRTGSITNRLIEIPYAKTHKLSPSQFKTPTGQSPNLISRFDNWFRSRTGSVPSRPPFANRRRHRTQSEGEKDSPENQEPEDK